MGTGLRWVNELLAFALELAAFVALGAWGVATGPGPLMKVLLGAGAPALAAVLWWLFAAPRAAFAVPLAVVLLVKAVVFGAASLALAVTWHPVAAVGFAVVAAANATVITVARCRKPLPELGRAVR